MSRKPVHLAQAGGQPTGRQAVWEAIRSMRGETFTAKDIWHRTHAGRSLVDEYLVCLEAAKIINCVTDRANRLPGHPIVYLLVDDRGIEAPRVNAKGEPVTMGMATEQMWRTMRLIGKDFSPEELAICATTEEHPVSPVHAADYCRMMAKAGYLMPVAAMTAKKRKPPRYRWVQARYPGPKPPMIQRLNTVYDPNSRQIVWHAEVPE